VTERSLDVRILQGSNVSEIVQAIHQEPHGNLILVQDRA